MEKCSRDGLQARYGAINGAGRTAVLAGNVQPYFWPDALKDRYSVFALIKMNDFFQMLLDKAEFIEKKFGLTLLLAGRDYAPHFTVLEGNYYKEKDRKDFTGSIRAFLRGNKLDPKEKEMLSCRILIDQLVCDKGNLLMVSIGSPFFGIRKKLAAFYPTINLDPCPLDITHSCITRVTKIPQGFGVKDWAEYLKYVEGLQRFLLSNYLLLKLEGTYSGEAYKFLTTKAR